ncbi:MAG: DEAD/DEAH box helicase [Candidatus Lokiarchaeota archaeon]|nr:DEAD/DEAH box helicase [Candidatus Lokiarchaeota archaeon]
MLWPDALVQLSPSYQMGRSVADLVDDKVLHPMCRQIFRNNDGDSFRLYKHQEEAIHTAARKESYLLTTGTGSGKSLTYLIPIIDHILKNDPSPEKVRALIVYPMNALINSQEIAIANLLNNLGENPNYIRFARYTGQEDQNRREILQQHPPHILLTNYVMLELMMSRPQERIFLESTLSNLEILVFDELHTYTGRRGADVAMLIRRVRQRCGNDKLLCIGTSATMATGNTRDEERKTAAEVASKIFGVDIPIENVIDEKIKSSFPKENEPTRQALIEILQEDVPSNAANFLQNPLAKWIEDNFGIEDREGFLKRRTPITLKQGSKLLSELTGVEEEICNDKIAIYLQKGSELHNSDGSPIYALRLHQFISQGDSVYATMEALSERQFTLTGQLFAHSSDGEERLFVPLSFCRECGQEYYQVTLSINKNTVEPRTWYDTEAQSNKNLIEGYILLEDGEDSVWSDERLEELPDNWFRETKKGRSIVPRYRDFIPKKVYISPDGSVFNAPQNDTLPGWFIKLPLLICPSCGAVYDKRTSEFKKLSRLSSEGRSTATTLLALTTVKELMHERDVPADARKILSFTDNRQDASLQSGHFNDFIQVALIRNGIYKALPENGYLSHDTVASTVVDALNLPSEIYAKNPSQSGIMPRKNREAFTALIEYNLYRDLRRGWRIVQPNLEQCGLLNIAYEGLEELCKDDELWQGNSVLAQADADMRFEVAKVFLDHLRRSLALNVQCLKGAYQETLKRKVNETLNDAWCFDDNEILEESEWFRYGKSMKGKFSLATTSLVGRYLRSKRAWQFLETNLSTDEYEEFINRFIDILYSGGYLHVERADADFRVQLNVITLQWKKGSGFSDIIDQVRNIFLKNSNLESRIKNVNEYFTNFYKNNAHKLYMFESREHTGQTKQDDREKREQLFRQGNLSTLFCSPTMELGIDISDLVSVNMRNVPPTPANYAQRSGRAGRAGQPAFISTYCSMGSGHDQYFFNKRNDMVAGKVIPTRLELSNRELIESHIHSIWLSVVNINLKNSIADILDLSNPDLPLNPNIKHQIQLSENKILLCLDISRKVLKQIALELNESMWYSDEWLISTIRKVPELFDRSFDRWRDLYRSADRQLEEAQRTIRESAQLRLSYQEVRKAERAEREARHQKELLCNQTKKFEDSDFYPYRYLASEDFLPGYNFPRLPLRAYIPGETEGIFLSRGRFLALNEYGPRNIIYHEGRKYRVVKSILPPGEIESRFSQAKVCRACGYIHGSNDIKLDNCLNCKNSLDGENSEYFEHLFEMTSVATQPWEKINCNEEERLRKGFEVSTQFRFSRVDGKDQKVCAETVDESGNPMLNLAFAPSAILWRINLGWRKKESPGFKFDLNQGIWDKQAGDNQDTALDAGVENVRYPVFPFVRDVRNILLIKAAVNLHINEQILTNLQHALHRGLCAAFNIDESEIASERIGRDEYRSILFWEAAEGGVGVLHRLIHEAGAIANIAKLALEICHFNSATEIDRDTDCVRACYHCLLSYQNQNDHKALNRHLVKELLLNLQDSKTRKGHENLSYKQHYEKLRAQTDSRSQLEKDFLDHLFREGRRLPDEAQKLLEAYYCKPDFFYRDGYVCVFCDGSVHDDPEQKDKDNQIRNNLKSSGFRVVKIRYDEPIKDQVERYSDVFGVVTE